MAKKSVAKMLLLAAVCLLVTSTSYAITDETPGRYTKNGPYQTSSYDLYRVNRSIPNNATVYYPTNANSEGGLSGIVFCPPLTGVQLMYRAWGPFFASHGIVMVTMDTRTTQDVVDSRARQQKTVMDALKAENNRSGSPLQGKLNTDNIGACGWSMGGGATWINSAQYPGIKTAMSLAGHNMTAIDLDSKGGSTKCPILIMNGSTDMTILGGLGQSSGVYRSVPGGIPKILYEVSTAGHFSWGTPTQASDDVAIISLAFQKTFLDGDTRWAQFIQRPSRRVGTWRTENINNF